MKHDAQTLRALAAANGHSPRGMKRAIRRTARRLHKDCDQC